MKILGIFDNINTIDQPLRKKAESGKFYNCRRVSIEKENAKFVVISMNPFERVIAPLLKLFCIDYKSKVLAKKIKKNAQITKIDAASVNVLRSDFTSISPDLKSNHLSFSEYRKQQESRKEPVDLIVGRGTIVKSNYPCLNTFREFVETGIKAPYKPFTVDIDIETLPDVVASIASLKQMRVFPDCSVDEIYLERIFPLAILVNIHTYCNAARILKVGGSVLVDFNNGTHPREFQTQIEVKMDAVFKKYQIPLMRSVATSRSNLSDRFAKFAFTKYADFDSSISRNLLLAQEELRQIKYDA